MLLDALAGAGYDRSFELLAPIWDQPESDPCQVQHGLSQIEWDPTTRTLTLPQGVHLDFGGIVKGWAAYKTVNRLKKYGPVLMDAAGDIAISDRRSNGECWPVGVADPFNPPDNLELLKLDTCGVATSGKDRRRWQQNGNWTQHPYPALVLEKPTLFSIESYFDRRSWKRSSLV